MNSLTKYFCTVLFSFGFLILNAQNQFKQLSDNVFYKDTLLIRLDEEYDAFLFYNKAEDIYIVSVDSMSTRDDLLNKYPSTKSWKSFNDNLLHLSFLYPTEYTVQRTMNEMEPTYKIGQYRTSDNNFKEFQANVLVTITTKTFEKSIEDCFEKDGDLWIVIGHNPREGNYLFGRNVRAIYGEQAVAIPSEEGIGFVDTYEEVFFIFVRINDKYNAAIQYQNYLKDNIRYVDLMQLAISIQIK